MKIDVLDKGFVELMMCADSDLTVVNCARVSFGKESVLEKEHRPNCPALSAWDIPNACACDRPRLYLSDRDTKLIHYLARENHWSPFAHPQIRLRVKAPIFIRTQLFKHKFGAVENEVSRRYVDDGPEFYAPDVWRGRPDKSIKQGSEGVVRAIPYESTGLPEAWDTDPGSLSNTHNESLLYLYNTMLKGGVAPEQARMVLPQSTYTEWIWTGSLAFFARVYNQRSDPHAQWEAQQYAKAIGEIVEPLFPVSWKALTT